MADEPRNEPGPFDVPTIRLLAALMSRHDLSEIDLREGARRIRLLRGAPPIAVAAPTPAPHIPRRPSSHRRGAGAGVG